MMESPEYLEVCCTCRNWDACLQSKYPIPLRDEKLNQELYCNDGICNLTNRSEDRYRHYKFDYCNSYQTHAYNPYSAAADRRKRIAAIAEEFERQPHLVGMESEEDRLSNQITHLIPKLDHGKWLEELKAFKQRLEEIAEKKGESECEPT